LDCGAKPPKTREDLDAQVDWAVGMCLSTAAPRAPLADEPDPSAADYGSQRMDEISPEAEHAGLLAATQALLVGLLTTLRRREVLSQEDIDQLFEAGLITFERGEQTETRIAARLTLEILARSLSTSAANSNEA
jgi:hypothetical protein